MTRVGVVGAGTMGQHHARVYAEMGAELVGIADPDLARAEVVAGKYGIGCEADYRQLIGRVDAVSIAVPTSLHREIAVDFMRNGVHCLVEKPIAPTIDQAEEMVSEAGKSGVKLMVGHIERFNPVVARLKEFIDRGVLGELMIISTRRVGPFVSRIRDVGIIIDTATHDIDIARYLVGKEPIGVFSKAGKFRHQKEDHAIVVLDFGSTTACIEVNWFTPHKVRSLVATGSEGIAYLDYIEQEVTVHNHSKDARTVKMEKMEPLRLELEHFLGCIQYNTEPLVNGWEAVSTLDIALRAERVVAHV